jgi:membrane-associated protease RseP (regulator of RpoE activity)
MNNNYATKIVLGIACVLSGCASITEGTTQDISVVTNPPGASCAFERQGMVIARISQTPQTVNVTKRKYDITIKCNKPGFQEAAYLNHSGVTAVIAANVATDLLLTAGISSIIDSSTGADNKYDSAVNITLIQIIADNVPMTPIPLTTSTMAVAPERQPVQAVAISAQKPNLGVAGGTVTRFDVAGRQFTDPYGAWVDGVVPRSAAAAAGLRRGDIVRTFNGHRVSTFEELDSYTQEAVPGTTVKLGIWRDGELIAVDVGL